MKESPVWMLFKISSECNVVVVFLLAAATLARDEGKHISGNSDKWVAR